MVSDVERYWEDVSADISAGVRDFSQAANDAFGALDGGAKCAGRFGKVDSE